MERTRITNRIKADMTRLGICGFKPYLRSAPKKLAAVRIAAGVAIPFNTTAELKRDMARLTVLHEQIAAIEKTRLERGGCERLSYRDKSGYKQRWVVAGWCPVSQEARCFRTIC